MRSRPASLPGALLSLLVLATALAAAAQEASDDESPVAAGPTEPTQGHELVFGMTPIFDVESTRARFSPLAELLASKLGLRVTVRVTDSYDELVEELKAGRVDLVKLSPLAYVKARERVRDLKLLATQVANGSTDYSSYLVALAPSLAPDKQPKKRLTPREKLLGKRVCFADKGSTSGYLFPLAWMSKHGIDPQADLREIHFGGSHLDCLKGLFDGRWDVAATWAGAIRAAREDQAARQAGVDVGEIMIVAKTGRIPYDAWCVRPGLSPALAARIERVLESTSTLTQEGRRALAPTLGINGWVLQTEDRVYDGVREVWEAHRSARSDHE